MIQGIENSGVLSARDEFARTALHALLIGTPIQDMSDIIAITDTAFKIADKAIECSNEYSLATSERPNQPR